MGRLGGGQRSTGMQAKVRQWWSGAGSEVGTRARTAMAMAAFLNNYMAQTREDGRGGSGAWACRHAGQGEVGQGSGRVAACNGGVRG